MTSHAAGTPEPAVYDTFEQFMAIAFPWLKPVGADYRNLREAWEAGHAAGIKAGREAN